MIRLSGLRIGVPCTLSLGSECVEQRQKAGVPIRTLQGGFRRRRPPSQRLVENDRDNLPFIGLDRVYHLLTHCHGYHILSVIILQHPPCSEKLVRERHGQICTASSQKSARDFFLAMGCAYLYGLLSSSMACNRLPISSSVDSNMSNHEGVHTFAASRKPSLRLRDHKMSNRQ
jgi:hypothetical protein